MKNAKSLSLIVGAFIFTTLAPDAFAKYVEDEAVVGALYISNDPQQSPTFGRLKEVKNNGDLVIVNLVWSDVQKKWLEEDSQTAEIWKVSKEEKCFKDLCKGDRTFVDKLGLAEVQHIFSNGRFFYRGVYPNGTLSGIMSESKYWYSSKVPTDAEAVNRINGPVRKTASESGAVNDGSRRKRIEPEGVSNSTEGPRNDAAPAK